MPGIVIPVAVACRLALIPPAAATACRWVAVWGMIGYVMLSFAFSRASERVNKRRVLASRA